MRRRRFLGIGAGLAGAVGLSGATACSGDSGKGQVLLKLVATEYGESGDSGTTEQYWNDVVAEFREQHPDILIDVSVVRYEDADAEVARMVREGEPPDIAQISTFADFAEGSQLYPASELLRIPVLADFIPSIISAGERGHVQYAMPFASIITGFFYNKDLFAGAGLDPEAPPRDWEELLQAAMALQAVGVPTPFGMPFGHDDAHVEAATWMLSGGGGLTDTAGGYVIDQPANVSTFTWLRDQLVGGGLTGPDDPARTSRDDIYAGFAQGGVGMLIADTALMRPADIGGVAYGTAPMPGINEPTPTALGDASWVMAFNGSGRDTEIGTFLQFVFTTDSVLGFPERYELLPVTIPAADAMSASNDPQQKRLVPFLEALPTATFLPVGKVSWASVSATLADGIGETMRPNGDIPAILGRLQVEAEAADRQE